MRQAGHLGQMTPHDLARDYPAQEPDAEPPPPPPAIEWPEPTISLDMEAQAPYPVEVMPELMQWAAYGMMQLTGVSEAMAYTVLWAALSGVASMDYRVHGLSPEPSPLTVYCVCAAPSGQRKSTAARLAMQPFDDADQVAIAEWDRAKRFWGGLRKAEERAAHPDRQPSEWRPSILRSDGTIQALLRRLAQGRPVQVHYLSELASFSAGWTGRPDQKTKAYHDLADIWDSSVVRIDRATDDVEITARGRCMVQLFMGQLDPTSSWIMDPAAVNGYSVRVWLCYQDVRQPLPPDLGRSEIAEATKHLDGLRRIIVARLRQQNDGIALASWQRPDAISIPLDILAHSLLRDYAEECDLLGETAEVDGDALRSYWLSRAAEHATRGAGLIAALRTYQGGSAQVQEDDVAAGIALARWYGDELSRVSAIGAHTEAAQDAQEAWRRIGAEVMARDGAVKTDVDGQIVGNIRRILARGGGGPLRRDPERRDRAIARLETEGMIERLPGKASWAIHPSSR